MMNKNTIYFNGNPLNCKNLIIDEFDYLVYLNINGKKSHVKSFMEALRIGNWNNGTNETILNKELLICFSTKYAGFKIEYNELEQNYCQAIYYDEDILNKPNHILCEENISPEKLFYIWLKKNQPLPIDESIINKLFEIAQDEELIRYIFNHNGIGDINLIRIDFKLRDPEYLSNFIENEVL